MSKKAEMDRLWRMIVLKDKEVEEELKICRKQQRRTLRYDNLVRDAAKLKAEYEKLKGMGITNPVSVDHNEKLMREKAIGDIMGRSGSDTHHGLTGDKDRNYK